MGVMLEAGDFVHLGVDAMAMHCVRTVHRL